MESQPQNPEFRNNPNKLSPMHFYSLVQWVKGGKAKKKNRCVYGLPTDPVL